ncbi:MAG: hypothetical protein ACI906_004998, partial [Candidatus Latescibacterota bacterium]
MGTDRLLAAKVPCISFMGDLLFERKRRAVK